MKPPMLEPFFRERNRENEQRNRRNGEGKEKYKEEENLGLLGGRRWHTRFVGINVYILSKSSDLLYENSDIYSN